MNTHRFLAFLAAILITVGQTLVFATDTAASTPGAASAIGVPRSSHAGSLEA